MHWDREAEPLLNSPAWGSYQTYSLVVNCGELKKMKGVTPLSVRKMLSGMLGLQSLDLFGYMAGTTSLQLEDLCLPSLWSTFFHFASEVR